MMSNAAHPPLLQVEHLSVRFPRPDGGMAAVVDSASFHILQGETLALVGESGAGKSMTGLALLRLVPPPAAVEGRILWQGSDLLALPPARLRAIRGREIGMIFQEPSAMMNPAFSVGAQLAEVYRCHQGLGRREAKRAAVALLDRVRIDRAAERFGDSPRQMSGGMLQRVMIAIAVACRPRLLIADEPTTALDAPVQRQIMELLAELQAELGMALLLITHNLGLVAEMADRVAIMREGRLVEQAEVRALFAAPQAAYTRELLAAAPRPFPAGSAS